MTKTRVAAASAAPVDSTHLDRLCDRALSAGVSGRFALTAAFWRHAADEALRLHGETLVCTFLTLQGCVALLCQTQLEGVSREEKEALRAEVWALTSSSLPLIVRRMDDGTMLPGRCTALEYAFFKKSLMLKSSALREPPLSARQLHLVGLCFGYASGLAAANALLDFVRTRHEADAEAFVLRVLDCMLLAS